MDCIQDGVDRIEQVLSKYGEGGIPPLKSSSRMAAIVVFSDPSSSVSAKRMAKEIIRKTRKPHAVSGKKHYMVKRKKQKEYAFMSRLRNYERVSYRNFLYYHRKDEVEITYEQYRHFLKWKHEIGLKYDRKTARKPSWRILRCDPLLPYRVDNCYVLDANEGGTQFLMSDLYL